MNFLKQRIRRGAAVDYCAAVGVAASGVLVAMALAWLLLAQMNFSYPIWHDYGGIEQAIERYGPENQFRDDFHLTTREQRFELFAGINRAIHRGGEGLETMTFDVPGQPPQLLFTEPEVIHLQDVAHLVGLGLNLAWGALVVWLLVWAWIIWRPMKLPSLKHQFLALLAVVAVTSVVVLLIGPVRVFYGLHDWLFPPDNPWFFYYQESLMATMMYAPYLFGWIALEWLVFTIILFLLVQGLAAKVAGRLQQLIKSPR